MKYVFFALGGYLIGTLFWNSGLPRPLKGDEFPWIIFSILMSFGFGALFAYQDRK
jgi:hypothetical protein